MRHQPKKHGGFIRPTITRDHYVLGGSPVPFVAVKPDGDWTKSMPVGEVQDVLFETYDCTGFGVLNQIEAYMKLVFGLEDNYSDRWVGVISGTKEGGNDPQAVYEAIRKNGLILEEMLPFSKDLKNIGEYYSFKGADEEACRAAGRAWLEKYEFLHEWVFGDGLTEDERAHNMRVALTASPLAIAVYAWAKDARGVYVAAGPENHWTALRAYDDLERVFDSYDPVMKDADQPVNFCKRIYIREKTVPVPTSPKKRCCLATLMDKIRNKK